MWIKSLLVWVIISSSFVKAASQDAAFFSNWVKDNFPLCELSKEVLFLDQSFKERIKKKFKLTLTNSILLSFQGKCNKIETQVLINSRIVRTLNQTLALKIQKKQIQEIKIIDFSEPPSYRPSKKWLQLFTNKNFSKLKKIDAISGATLTRRSTIHIAQEALIIDEAY